MVHVGMTGLPVSSYFIIRSCSNEGEQEESPAAHESERWALHRSSDVPVSQESWRRRSRHKGNLRVPEPRKTCQEDK